MKMIRRVGESCSAWQTEQMPKSDLKKGRKKKLDMTVKLFSDGRTETKINGLRIYLLLGLLTLRWSIKTLDDIQKESAA